MKNSKSPISFKLVKKHFHQLACQECGSHFEENGIKLIKETDDYIVIKVTCLKCYKSSAALLFDSYTMLAPQNNLTEEDKHKLKNPKRSKETGPLN